MSSQDRAMFRITCRSLGFSACSAQSMHASENCLMLRVVTISASAASPFQRKTSRNNKSESVYESLASAIRSGEEAAVLGLGDAIGVARG